jgi:hypothetical protein
MTRTDPHKPEAELLALLSDCAQQVFVGGTYTHYKDPSHTYTVIDLVINEADETVNVIYQADYGARLKFDRPFTVFTSTVEYKGREVARFKRID